MTGLLYAHSGLRYLILLVGLAGVLVFLAGTLKKQPLAAPGRILGLSFTGLVDLQIVLGLLSLMVRPFSPILIGHITMMVLGAALAHTLIIVNRRRPSPGNLLPLIGVGLALICIAVGIFAIGRSLLQATHFTS